MEYNSIIALDVGERRIGVALASLQARLSAPFVTIDRKKTIDALKEIENIVKKHHVQTVVVGLPRGLEGQETDQTRLVRAFAVSLESILQDIPVELIDEAVTSAEAEARLQSRGKPYDKGDIDAEAAAIILQDYLSQCERNLA